MTLSLTALLPTGRLTYTHLQDTHEGKSEMRDSNSQPRHPKCRRLPN